MLSEKLKKLMEEKGINANQLSNATNIPYSSIADWLKGSTTPKIDKLVKLAKYFGVTIDDLLKDEVIA